MSPSFEPRHRRIIVIDDNHAIHQDFAKVLDNRKPPSALLADLESDLFGDDAAPEPERNSTPMQFDVAFADQGEKGAEIVEKAMAEGNPFSVAFVDMRMPPGWDGIQTIRRLWEIDPDLQCVICTAYSDYSWEMILDELGISDRLLLLRKPFDAAEVSQLACALTEKWHLARHAHLKLEQLRSMVEEQTAHLAESEARYALAAAGANDGLWDWNLKTDRVFYSPRWSALLGLPSTEPLLSNVDHWVGLVHEEDAPLLRAALDDLRSGAVEQLSIEYRIRHHDGQYRWMHCRGALQRGANGAPARAAGSQTDVTSRKVAETQLRHDAFHDALTGLPNRALLTERLTRCVLRQQRDHAYRYAVMFIDLDRFKIVNDSLGHGVGDALLVALSKRLSGCVRAVDTIASPESRVARLGGDEFVVLLEGITQDADALRVAERLLASTAEPINAEGHTLHASLSIGVAIGNPTYQRADDILRDADIALYRAKAEGRGRYGVFSDELHAAAVSRWKTETELRSAIGRGDLHILLQPIVALDTGEVQSFEALVRWRKEDGSVVAPGNFIPMAEETGLVLPLGKWVVEEVCRVIAAWQSLGLRVPIAANVASKQFSNAGFFEEIRGALDATGVPPELLHLEITEGATMDPKATETCERLARLGVKLYLDDFGTGYSSLSYLARMPIDTLKVDRSFVARLTEDPMSRSITQTIIKLAEALRMGVIAEGVETEQQRDALRELHCSLGQGFLFARPLSVDAALELVARRRARAPSLGPVSLAPAAH